MSLKIKDIDVRKKLFRIIQYVNSLLILLLLHMKSMGWLATRGITHGKFEGGKSGRARSFVAVQNACEPGNPLSNPSTSNSPSSDFRSVQMSLKSDIPSGSLTSVFDLMMYLPSATFLKCPCSSSNFPSHTRACVSSSSNWGFEGVTGTGAPTCGGVCEKPFAVASDSRRKQKV